MTPDQVNKIVAAIQNNPNAVKQVAETTPTVPPEELKRRTTITNKSLNYYGMKIVVRDIDADKQDPNAEVMTLTIKTPENKTYEGSSRSLKGRFSNASDDV